LSGDFMLCLYRALRWRRMNHGRCIRTHGHRFVVEIKANEHGWVLQKCPLATSDEPQFHLWMPEHNARFAQAPASADIPPVCPRAHGGEEDG
jgi:hypothetical protein